MAGVAVSNASRSTHTAYLSGTIRPMTSQPQNAPRSPSRVKRNRVNPMTSVVVITAAALVGVGVLAVQANGSAPDKNTTVVATQTEQPAASTNPEGQKVTPPPDPTILPDNSGTGKRVVYSLSKSRIWLVGTDGKASVTAASVAGTENPSPGTYSVYHWRATGRSGDGASVQYQILWGTNSNPNMYGFAAIASLPADQMPPKPPAGTKTGSVRLTQNDAQALWQFVTVKKGMKIVVVP